MDFSSLQIPSSGASPSLMLLFFSPVLPDYVEIFLAGLASGDLGGQAGVDFDPSTPPKLVPFSNQLEMVSGGVSGVGGWIGKAGKRPGAESSGGEGLKCLHH